MAQLTLSSGALNDTEEITSVFDRLEEGDAFENVDEFLTQLSSHGQVLHTWMNDRDILIYTGKLETCHSLLFFPVYELIGIH